MHKKIIHTNVTCPHEHPFMHHYTYAFIPVIVVPGGRLVENEPSRGHPMIFKTHSPSSNFRTTVMLSTFVFRVDVKITSDWSKLLFIESNSQTNYTHTKQQKNKNMTLAEGFVLRHWQSGQGHKCPRAWQFFLARPGYKVKKLQLRPFILLFQYQINIGARGRST